MLANVIRPSGATQTAGVPPNFCLRPRVSLVFAHVTEIVPLSTDSPALGRRFMAYLEEIQSTSSPPSRKEPTFLKQTQIIHLPQRIQDDGLAGTDRHAESARDGFVADAELWRSTKQVFLFQFDGQDAFFLRRNAFKRQSPAHAKAPTTIRCSWGPSRGWKIRYLARN